MPGSLHKRSSTAFFGLWVIALTIFLAYGRSALAASYVESAETPPPISREFRAAWIATVANIDWPSTNGLSCAAQKSELLALIQSACRLKLNALIFQVRPACDALYSSKLEPWSEYLTGTMGKAPQPFFDPLAVAIREAHSRGMELHAWFNPYRARHQSGKSAISPNHISRTRPQLVRQYGNSLWLDPGEKEVQDYSLKVVMDVVRRYDIDGVHFDDYFYPYKEQDASGRVIPFPDNRSWQRYGISSGLSRDDWRRANVDHFLERVYRSIKAEKPWVKFGISPFGIWRPGYPPAIRGKDAYEELYADSRKWLQKGWADYFSPQLYWSIDSPGQSFPLLLKWWAQQNELGRHLWIGLNTYNAGRTWKNDEIFNQIQLTRGQQGVSGHVHWDLRKGVVMNTGLQQSLSGRAYAELALVPSSPWLSKTSPAKPVLKATQTSRNTICDWRTPVKPRWWLLQWRTGGKWQSQVLPASSNHKRWTAGAPEVIALTAVDAFGVASRPAVVKLASGK